MRAGMEQRRLREEENLKRFLKQGGPAIFGAGVVLLMLLALWLSWRSSFSRAVRDGQAVFGLLIGTDWVDYARHADTIILAKYDPGIPSLDLLSIPRDTKIDLPKMKVKRINEVYAYAFKTGGKDHTYASQELSRAVQWILFKGTSAEFAETFSENHRESLPVHFYAEIGYEGFKRMIDLLGGISVTVDEPMHYDDHWGKLHIHFDPGTYRLNGQKALEFVRFRGVSGDAGRVRRQQEFLLNVLGSFKNPVNLIKLPRIIWISISSIETNLNWFERLLVLWELKGLSREQVRLVQLPGRALKGFWIPDPGAVQATASLLLTGKRPSQEIPSKTTVEVWNASGKKGLALEVVHRLRSSGFDVVKWGNYSSIQQRTLVRDHSGETQSARAIAQALGFSGMEVFTHLESDPLVDVEVILGEDCGSEN
jgi:LCP family protein required for cell wall assembly